MTFDRKAHWEKIYDTKALNEVSWYQPTPETSLHFFKKYEIPRKAKIIDIGGGDSFLVDHLLEMGYENITVLDISEKALERAQKRLGQKANKVNWICADAAHFTTDEKYDLWHDRAALHFLSNSNDVAHYMQTLNKSLNTEGIAVIGTFSTEGPEKCSGINIQQYSSESLKSLFPDNFETIECFHTEHQTPSSSIQDFIFCGFRKIKS